MKYNLCNCKPDKNYCICVYRFEVFS